MIKAVVFDFGNVLSRLERPATDAAIAARCGLSAEEVARRIWGGAIERDSESGRYGSQEHFRRIKEAVGAPDSWVYEEFVEDFGRCIVPHPAGEAALAAMAAKGLRTFVLSNTNYLHSLLIFGREILATVPELHALSYKIGAMKPDPRIWNWLLEHSGLGAKDCLYVDDVEAYCAAARSIGFSTLHYHVASGDLLEALEKAL